MIWVTALAMAAMAAETRSLERGAQPAPATVADFAWLEGSWTGDGIDAPASETYSGVQAGQIAGHFVQQKPGGGVAFYELMQIVARGRSVVYRVRHFNADLTGWEDAKSGKAVEFPLVAMSAERIDFDGLSFRRTSPDTLTVWVRVDHDGSTGELAFRYRRVKR